MDICFYYPMDMTRMENGFTNGLARNFLGNCFAIETHYITAKKNILCIAKNKPLSVFKCRSKVVVGAVNKFK